MTLVKAVPVRPEEGYWVALKDCDDDEREAPEYYEDDSSPEKSLHRGAGKDADIEEDEGELEQHDLRKVQASHDVEVLEHLGDFLGAQCPQILAETMFDGPVYSDNRTWSRGHQCG